MRARAQALRGTDDFIAVVKGFNDDHPATPEAMLALYREATDEARAFCVEHELTAQLANLQIGGRLGGAYEVALLDALSTDDAARDRTILRQQQQAAAGTVETASDRQRLRLGSDLLTPARIDAAVRVCRRHQLPRRRLARLRLRADDADRLVQDNRDLCGKLLLRVGSDADIGVRSRLATLLAHDDAVDQHQTALDQTLGGATAAQAAAGHQLGDTLLLHHEECPAARTG
jgi:hypothetical protein